MITSIQPVTVARNSSGPVSAAAISFYTNFDDQATTATWFYQYGNMVDADLNPTFAGVDNAIGNLIMSGTDYTSWNGSAAQAKAWVLAQLNLTAA